MNNKNEYLEESIQVSKDIRKQGEFGHTLGIIILVIEIIAFGICFWIGTTGSSLY